GVAICQDRRYPESYRCLALQGAELILIGYNTPISPLALDLNELCMRSGAYANLCFVVGVAKAGVEDGVELIGGSCIIGPEGQGVQGGRRSGGPGDPPSTRPRRPESVGFPSVAATPSTPRVSPSG